MFGQRHYTLGGLVGLASLALIACAAPPPPPAPGPQQQAAAAAPVAEAPAAIAPSPATAAQPAPAKQEAHAEPAAEREHATQSREQKADAGMPMAKPGMMSRGLELFRSKGCASCHGQNAEGTAIGPALPGHIAEVIRRQVRTPRAKMPALPPQQLSDEELDAIISYITSLPVPIAAHGHEYEATVPEAQHLMMALHALKGEDTRDALHHLQHVQELKAPAAERRERINAILAALRAGKTHDGEHELAELVPQAEGMAEMTLGSLHLELALSQIEAKQLDDAKHHLRHAIQTGEAKWVKAAREALAKLDAGDAHEAEDIVRDTTKTKERKAGH